MTNDDRDNLIDLDLEDLDIEPRQTQANHSGRIEIDLDAEDLSAITPPTQYNRPSYDRAQIGQTAYYQEPIRQQQDTSRGNDWSNSSREQASARSARSGPRMNQDGFYEYEKAANGPRFLAFLVDFLIAFFPFFLGGAINLYNVSRMFSPNTTASSYYTLTTIALVLMIGGLLWSMIYLLIRDGLGKGQSIGKKLFGLMTVRLEDNQPCTKANSMIRNIIGVATSGIVDLLYGAVHNKGQRIGDVQLKTQVIHIREYKALRSPR